MIRDGAVVTERYLAGMRETDTHLLMSCSKSLTSILCGVLAGRGLLTPDDLVTDHLPELAGSAWEGCRLQHLLDMRAGNAWDYDVDEYTILDVSDYRTHDSRRHASRATPRPGSGRSAAARTTTAAGRSATARSPPTCSAGCSSAPAAPRSPSCSRARSGRGSAPSRTRRSCSTAPASQSSRAASARRCAISRASG